MEAIFENHDGLLVGVGDGVAFFSATGATFSARGGWV